MSHELTEEQIAIREMAEGFALERMASFAGEWDAAKTLPVETLREAAALGLGGITVRESSGGSGLKHLNSARIFEALSEGMHFERRVFHSMFATADQKEGMAAFSEKRAPDFAHG